MDKKTLARFAPAERIYLRTAVEKRLKSFGLNKDGLPNFNDWLSVDGSFIVINQKRYPKTLLQSFKGLYNEYKKVGYDQLVEELAYTWFNRFMAIRYMEVNGVLPDYVKIIERDSITRRPEIMDNYEHLKVNKEEIEELKHNNLEEEAYRKLLLASVNKLGEVMPFLFEQLQDWTELVLPDKMLDPNGLVDRVLTEEGLTESFIDGVESIGWMYQYYISEIKEEVMKEKKVNKDKVPARTQIFTPKWVVKYMVENSLGRLWIDANNDSTLSDCMEYLIKEPKQEDSVKDFLNEISYKDKNIEEITFLDPAMGSGHILAYAYDLFFNIYKEMGYSKREIGTLILKNNLFGIDVDKRATQLAAFTLTMKAVETSGRAYWRNIVTPNCIEIKESNSIDSTYLEQVFSRENFVEISKLLNEYKNSKEYGSLLSGSKDLNLKNLEEEMKSAKQKRLDDGQISMFDLEDILTWNLHDHIHLIEELIHQDKVLKSRYDVVVANPPYMGNSAMSEKLSAFAKNSYANSKSDLFAMFIERILDFTKEKGFSACVTMQSWMFLSTYEKLRKSVMNEYGITSTVHMGNGVMGIAFGTAASVFRKGLKSYLGQYMYVTMDDLDNGKPKRFPVENERYIATKVNDFSNIPGSPIAYWADDSIYEAFKNNPSLDEIADVKQGIATADNERFLRYWWEIDYSNIGFGMKNAVEAKESKKKWFPFNKGGGFRKWYGNIEHVINWENDGSEIKSFVDERGKLKSRPQNLEYMFKEGITLPRITSGDISVRYVPPGVLFDSAVSMAFPKPEVSLYDVLGSLGTDITNKYLRLLNPTINSQSGDYTRIPIKLSNDRGAKEKEELVKQLIDISKAEWNSSEISFHFNDDKYQQTSSFSAQIKLNQKQRVSWLSDTVTKEEELNNIVMEENGLSIRQIENKKELKKELFSKSIEEEVIEFCSYFIGCTLGRFSLDVEGVASTGNHYENSKNRVYEPVAEGILTFTDEQVLPDEQDVYKRLQEFLRVLYGEETLQENLVFIAEILGKKPKETTEQTIRGYFMKDFVKDHIQLYKKRPIYWLVDSGKQKGMQSLIYMHRYTPYTLGLAMQNHFVPLLSQWRNLERVTLDDMENEDITPAVKKELTKKLDVYKKRRVELETFQDKLNYFARQEIPIDLDDGVKVNYQKFNGILKEIKF